MESAMSLLLIPYDVFKARSSAPEPKEINLEKLVLF